MIVARRRLAQAVFALPMLAVASKAEAATIDIVLTCDTALGPLMRAAAARYLQQTGVRVRVFPTGPGLVLPQLKHGIQNDVVCTQQAVAVKAMQAGLIGSGVLQGGWRNRLVIATCRGAGPTATALSLELSISFERPGTISDAIMRVSSPTPIKAAMPRRSAWRGTT
jgi:molybdate transport system substrate-binding protein